MVLWLDAQLIGWEGGWLIGWLVDWLVDWVVGLFGLLCGWVGR